MSIFSGKDGRVVFNGKATTRVSAWSFESSVDTLDVTDLGEGARSYVAGLKSSAGTMSIFYHDDDNSLLSILNNVITKGTPEAALLELRWTGKVVSMMAFINTATITCNVGEVMSAQLSFTATGELTQITL